MPLQATSGAASYDGFGGGVAVVPAYIEEVFSTYLYTGTAVAQTITNNIDLSTKGGMVWTKNRNYGISHGIVDTARGVLNTLITNNTDASASYQTVTAFGTTGFSVGTSAIANGVGDSTMVSWTFREQPKFFDVVTYTGNGVDNRDIAHSLGSTPGCIIVKCTNSTPAWRVFHRSLTAGNNMELNATDGQFADTAIKSCTDTTFRTNSGSNSNGSGNSYVAYLFAHDAGGFGLTGTDNVISCGSGTSNASGVIDPVTLGYEPQFVIAKATGTTSHWFMFDTMRGDSLTSISYLRANTSDAETTTTTTYLYPTATGFAGVGNFFGANQPFIYIAIRRGPMKVPTLGTSVFSPVARVGTSATATVTAGFPVDMTIIQDRNGLNSYATAFDRLRGATKRLFTALTLAEATEATSLTGFDVQTGFTLGTDLGFGAVNTSPDNYINWCFGRAPGFFDEVCYTGTGVATTQTHNLGVAPQLLIIKPRSAVNNWWVLAVSSATARVLNSDVAFQAAGATYFGDDTVYVAPTSSVFSIGSNGGVNGSGVTYVAYLFATCAGVSKVGNYTGTGTTLQINCGFTAGARFVLIKRTDSTGDWYVWDSARGIVAGNDPYLLLNSTAAEVTSTDYVDTYSAGFEISSTAPAAINASAGTFVFLAIA